MKRPERQVVSRAVEEEQIGIRILGALGKLVGRAWLGVLAPAEFPGDPLS